MTLDGDIKYLKGVGEKRAQLLNKELNITTIKDLLYYFPFRYIDRSRIFSISEITDDTATLVQIRVRIDGFKLIGERPKQRFVAEVSDPTGRAELVWFKGINWIQKSLKQGDYVIAFGRATIFNGRVNIVHPEIESPFKTDDKSINSSAQGVYSTTERLNDNGLGTKAIYKLICSMWPQVEPLIEETLPDWLIQKTGIAPLKEALYDIHFPRSQKALEQARVRLKFEELLGIQLHILSLRNHRTNTYKGYRFSKIGAAFNDFYTHRLPFALTEAQKRVIREIREDMGSGRQMNRLLQGDVGSGKTMVALMTMLIAIDNGFQCSLMAPTEILATQHYNSIREQLGDVNVRVALLTGSTKTKERQDILQRLADGQIDILIGTHALIEEAVQYKNLGYVVIDEQHRFGVEQRSRLWRKGSEQLPHILVMTATPIPRTLAMTLYGDLSVSIIDELPPGRKPVKTLHFTESLRLKVNGFLRREIDAGRQVYIVYPLILGSEKLDYQSLQEGAESLADVFPPPKYVTSIVHGKMKPAEKDYGMRLFVEGKSNMMIATSVIEVGVNVPNATVMVIESAERFGLAQLHQLRGRVGRGAEQSYCILMTKEGISADSRKRIEAMTRTTDGFEIAELDLKLRGPGDLAGTQQSGLAFDLKIASLAKDGALLERARTVAERILELDPELSHPQNSKLRILKKNFASAQGVDFSMIS
ncbi:MAG: ATP-dependent DNA helicase RecG [Rikenellaceae bacterium]|nr:ATP-dependent DNA helicase RecG [Rikenellaceae bacterium]